MVAMTIRKVFLKYPCGKLFELRFPITAINVEGKSYSILPGTEHYFEYAKKKFEINNLKVIEREVVDDILNQPMPFISLIKKYAV